MSTANEGYGKPRRVVDESQPPWFVPRPHIRSVALRLHEEVLDFVNYMKHTREEVLARRRWVRCIGVSCRELWPSCKVRVFGSFFTGLSLPNGDVDVAILDVPCTPGTAMKILADYMLSKGEVSWLEIIESAKVPVMKIRSQASGLRADVVFNQHDGLTSSKFVRDRLKEFSHMKPLLVFLKYFLMQRGLHETYTGGMGSYLLCNVVLHFLQRHPSRQSPGAYASISLGHMLFDLLQYYGREFRYESQGISVVDGGYTFRREPGQGKGGKGKGGKGGLSLTLQSPLDPHLDLGSACYRIGVLRNLFHHGYHCLCHSFTSQAPAEASMLSPFLLDPAHGVIASRFQLIAEQPVAMSGIPRAGSTADWCLPGAHAAVDLVEGGGPAASEDGASEPAAKRQRRDAVDGVDIDDI